MEKLKKIIFQLVKSHATAEEVAEGFALGVFISLTPTIGIQSYMALGLSTVLKKNKLAALIGVWLTNPLSAFPIYLFTFYIGRFFMPDEGPLQLRPESLTDVFHMSTDILIPLWIGGLALGLSLLFPSYYLALKGFPYFKKKKDQLRSKISKRRKQK